MKQALFAVTFLWSLLACQSQEKSSIQSDPQESNDQLVLGAERLQAYLPLLENKKVALVVNHTSLVGKTHLVDTLLRRGVDVVQVFAPEHGFRGAQEAGETVENSIDKATGLPIVSLYGANKKPTAAQLQEIDAVVFDIQDVGVRFYTYISTMSYVMEACAEQGKLVVILDRPNPNGDYVDGPILQPSQRSFVGLHPIPIVHGLTVAELAYMINEEKWLANEVKCTLELIEMENYHHQLIYHLPVKPSPNLPNYQSIRLYPSLCLFEGSQISIGRGTQFPFQVYGHPHFSDSNFSFTPVAIPGMDQNPKHKDLACGGIDLREIDAPTFTLSYVLDAYQKFENKDQFFKKYFNLLAGNERLMGQIESGLNEAEIRSSWEADLQNFKTMRKSYLLYPETSP